MGRIWIFGIILPFILASCGEHEEGEERPSDANRLFKTSCRLTSIYAEKIRLAQDSATAIGIFEEMQNELDSLNFSVPPDTDLQLTEGENDTIFMNLMAVRRIYDRKLRELKSNHQPEAEPTDSVVEL